MCFQNICRDGTRDSRSDRKSQPRHEHQCHPEFLGHIFGAQGERIGHDPSQTQTCGKPHPHQLRNCVRHCDQQRAYREEKHGRHNHRLPSHPVCKRCKPQASNDGAEPAGREYQSESGRLHCQCCTQGRGYVADRLRIEAIYKHRGSAQQEHLDLEASDFLLIN